MKRSLLLVLLLSFGLVLSACNQSDDGDDGDTDGGTTADLSYDLVDTAYASVSGTVEFSELDNGDIQATIDLGTTAEADASYPAHIHAGDAGSNGEIVVPLDNVVDGESVTTFNALEDGTAVTIESLETYDGYVNVHLPEDLGIVLASANIGANTELEVPTPGNIVETAQDNADLSLLVAALVAAELEDDLAADGEFTVFAPSNAAFQEVLGDDEGEIDTAEELLAAFTAAGLAIEDLPTILQYHVVGEAVAAGELEDGQTLTTLAGEELSVSIEGEEVTLSDGRDVAISVETPNVVTSNGVVHVIDFVLIPPSISGVGGEAVEVALTGANEVDPVETEFVGSAVVSLTGTTLRVNGAYSEDMVIAGPGAHIHGPADTTANAPILFPLEFDNDASTFAGSFDLSEGVTDSEDTEYTAEELLGFFATGQLYINLHTEANPGGELRGQIVPGTDEEDTDETN